MVLLKTYWCSIGVVLRGPATGGGYGVLLVVLLWVPGVLVNLMGGGGEGVSSQSSLA